MHVTSLSFILLRNENYLLYFLKPQNNVSCTYLDDSVLIIIFCFRGFCKNVERKDKYKYKYT